MTWIWFGRLEFGTKAKLRDWGKRRIDGKGLRWPAGFGGERLRAATADLDDGDDDE